MTQEKPVQSLREVLDLFNNRRTYHDLDSSALDISRSMAAGNFSEENYAEWAMLSNDPVVVVNLVKTYITTICSRLAAHPFRPEDDVLYNLGRRIRIDSTFIELYKDVLSDGYAFCAIGLSNGVPILKQIDSRYIYFTGDDPTLKDASDAIVFQILPREDDGLNDTEFRIDIPSDFVSYDSQTERIVSTYYHKNSDNTCTISIYNDYSSPPSQLTIECDRIPIIRFVGDKIELSDKRYHYRGLYYLTASVLKAMTLSATKIQIRNAASDDDNYIVQTDAVDNHINLWRNAGLKPIDNKDANGEPIDNPVTPIPHDNQFLLESFNIWRATIGDMLGHLVASGTEAITREEVLARNEVKDAITNDYLSKFVDSVSEVYRCINMIVGGTAPFEQRALPVVIVGGFLDTVKKSKANAEIMQLYTMAKDSGLNAQGFVFAVLDNADIPMHTKEVLGALLKKDPMASPLVKSLNEKISTLNQTINQQNQTIALLRIQATQRLERQAEYVAMEERVKNNQMRLEQWLAERKEAQEARTLLMKTLLEKGDIQGALLVLNQISSVTPPLVDDLSPREQSPMYQHTVAEQLNSAMNPTDNVGTPSAGAPIYNKNGAYNRPQNWMDNPAFSHNVSTVNSLGQSLNNSSNSTENS